MKLATLFLLIPVLVFAQDPPPTSPTTTATITTPLPAGMRLIVGSAGVLARNTPSLTGTCGADNHACTQADAVLPNTYGVVQSDAPVLDPGGWYWSRITFESGVTGWASVSSPDRIMMLNPPQMIQGSSFNVIADYSGPALTSARCISDGITSDAVMQLQPTTGGQFGTLRCAWKAPALGNHIQVIQAINPQGTAASQEFQFSITAAPVPPIPSAPTNLRIAPATTATIQVAK